MATGSSFASPSRRLLPTGATCFPGDGLLTLEDGSTVKFHDLTVGTTVASASRDGVVSYSPVIFTPHQRNNSTHKFDEIATDSGKTVRMTRNHLLPDCEGTLVTVGVDYTHILSNH